MSVVALDDTAGDIHGDGLIVHLTASEFAVFELLWRRFPSAVPASIIIDVLERASHSDGLSNSSVRVRIWALRRKLAPVAVAIETVFGFGYRLKGKEAAPCSPKARSDG